MMRAEDDADIVKRISRKEFTGAYAAHTIFYSVLCAAGHGV